ncbi:hypothetical protein [Plantactinospora endophytica]|uniref:CU044_5270 family protein n=1 Tax=Plantactinospora endophytica TaxID=673535 RepID=A0ABQ4E0X8_9ACTN|nr:hypothetical protein [Plantactinospora endophytica]GIG88363.1 hypothetical protein Pen02_32990 [Plantactinospora endophytica]
MSRTDPDLVAVRTLPPGLPEPDDEAVARTWRAVVSKRAARQRRPWRPRLVLPVTAAAVVCGLALGAGLLFAPSDTRVPDGTATPAGTVRYDGPVDVRAALDELTARAGTVDPVRIPDGQFIYVHTRTVAVPRLGDPAGSGTGEPGRPTAGMGPGGPASGAGTTPPPAAGRSDPSAEPLPTDLQMWVDPAGMIVLDARRNGVQVQLGGGETASEAIQRLFAEGPSLGLPTAQWLAELPTDPALLRTQLLAEVGERRGSPDRWLAEVLGTLLRTADPVLTPAVRVALYRVLGGLDGLSAARVTVDGREQYVIRHTEGVDVTDLLFDAGTGRSAGRATGRLDGAGVTGSGSASTSSAYPSGLRSQDLWSWAIVPELGRTR